MSTTSQNVPRVYPLMSGYVLRSGFVNSRPLLIEFLKAFYQEVFPHNQKLNEKAGDYANTFVNSWFVAKHPLLWVEPHTAYAQPESINLYTPVQKAVGCLFLVEVMDIYQGQPQGHIIFMFVYPSYRRQGIGTALIEYAKAWARTQGYAQLGLDVLMTNPSTLSLCQRLGFNPDEMRLINQLRKSPRWISRA